MNRFVLSVAFLTCLVWSSALGAAARGGRGAWFRQRLGRDDRNGDGKVTREEFTGPERLFRRFDRNGDRVIDPAEVGRFIQELPRQRRPGMRPDASLPENVEMIRDVVFGTGGERSLKLNIIRPKPQPAEPMPVVVWIHGGAWRAGSRHGLRTLGLAQHGYFTISIDYRLSQQAIFPAQIEDCKCAIRWLRAHAEKYGVDPKRIGVWGSSAGGHLVALLGTSGDVAELEGKGGWGDHSSRVQAVCDFFGPTDFIAMIGQDSHIDRATGACPEAQLVGGPLRERKEQCRKANPITYVTADDPPFLIVHGEQDRTVPINQSELLDAALKKAGVEVTFVRVRRGGHGFRGNTEPSPQRIQQMVAEFFDRHLKRPAQQ